MALQSLSHLSDKLAQAGGSGGQVVVGGRGSQAAGPAGQGGGVQRQAPRRRGQIVFILLLGRSRDFRIRIWQDFQFLYEEMLEKNQLYIFSWLKKLNLKRSYKISKNLKL